MLVTAAALHLLLAQLASPAPAAAPGAAGLQAQSDPWAEFGVRDERAFPPRGSRRQLSLLSAEPLGGGSVALAWAGWSSLGIMYGEGITAVDDLAGFADLDWAKTELRLGALYRRPLGEAGPFAMGGRLSAAWYGNFGAEWVHDENHSDRGFEVTPGLSFSRRGGRGIFSALAETPLTVTTRFGAGILFSPRFSVAYEAPLYPELTVGARFGLGYRAGAGDAPLERGRGELVFLVVASYQVL